MVAEILGPNAGMVEGQTVFIRNAREGACGVRCLNALKPRVATNYSIVLSNEITSKRVRDAHTIDYLTHIHVFSPEHVAAQGVGTGQNDSIKEWNAASLVQGRAAKRPARP